MLSTLRACRKTRTHMQREISGVASPPTPPRTMTAPASTSKACVVAVGGTCTCAAMEYKPGEAQRSVEALKMKVCDCLGATLTTHELTSGPACIFLERLASITAPVVGPATSRMSRLSAMVVFPVFVTRSLNCLDEPALICDRWQGGKKKEGGSGREG